MFDLARIDTPAAAETGATIDLEYNGKPTGWRVAIRGDYSPTVRKWQLGVGNKFRLKEWQEKRKGKGDNPAPMTEEDMEIGLRSASMRVIAWTGVVFNGADFPCTEANAYELVRRHPPFADQIIEASGDLSLFTKAQ